jgi:hypothetical protein
MRRCSQRLPLFRHSSHPSALGVTSLTSAMWLHPFAVTASHLVRCEEIHLDAPRSQAAGFADSAK